MQHGNAKRPGTQQSARKERTPLPSLTGALSRAMVAALTAAGALALAVLGAAQEHEVARRLG